MKYEKWLATYHPGADPKDSDLGELRRSGYVKAIIHYKDNGFWLFTNESAYEDGGVCVSRFWEILRNLSANGWRNHGHDNDPKLFSRRKGRAKKIEVLA